MKSYRICVYAIAKNEQDFVDRWMDSMQEADEIVVLDTGSTDQTVKLLRERGAVVHQEVIHPWRFDTARNISLNHVPEETDICVCTDLDEVLTPGWRAALERAWQPGTTQAKYLYNWSHHEDGTPDLQMYYTKIHSRAEYFWSYPVHEHLSYIGNLPERTVLVEGMALDHFPDLNKSRGDYLPLLEMAVKEDPSDARMLYYLGREYMYLHRWQECIDTLSLHLNLPFPTWEEERGASMRWIAKSHYALGNSYDALRWYYRAIGEVPNMREPYVEFAQMAYDLQNWPLVFHLTEQALAIPEKSQTYVNMGYAWDSTLSDLASIACWKLQMLTRSEQHAEKAVELNPANQRLQNNLRIIRAAVRASEPTAANVAEENEDS